MLFVVVLVSCLGGLVSSDPSVVYHIEEFESHFEDFIKTYKKSYSNENEKKMRFENFKNNLQKANNLNQMDDHAVYGITRFSDLTPAEFRSMYTGLKRPQDLQGSSRCQYKDSSNYRSGNSPDRFDWRIKKVVTRVKDQGPCGSCWAFSTVANIESQYAIVHKTLVEFSESQLVDCSNHTFGCKGGWMSNAVLDIQKMGGIMTESDYPYKPKNDRCSFDKTKVKAQIKDCNQYIFDNEHEMKDTLFNVGPLSVTVSAAHLMYYTRGIITQCGDKDVDHAVLLVGYCTENKIPYWVLKNSWTESFGEEGYFRIMRNVNCMNITSPTGMTTSAIVA